MQLRHISLSLLIDAAGGDPWRVNNSLQSGQPEVVADLAQAFHDAGACTEESSASFTQARRRFRAAWKGDGGEHPINDSAEVQRAADALRLQSTQLSAIATDLQNIGAALAEAQTSAGHAISVLEIQLQDVDNRIGGRLAHDAGADVSDLEHEAIDDTATMLDRVERIRAGYAETLQASARQLRADGYDPGVIQSYDGDGQLGQARDTRSAADAYREAVRDNDRESVDSPGEVTPAKADAAARLRDYATATDPAADPEARRVAGERLHDYDMSMFAGPLPPDTVLGGDARVRARDRLELQKRLESGELSPNGVPMTPGEATETVDRIEAAVRADVLDAFAGRLAQAGMSPDGVRRAVTAVQSGVAPHDFLKTAGGALSSELGAVGTGLQAEARALPTGRHWGSAGWSEADAAALKKLGTRVGSGGAAIDLALTARDVLNGEPLLPATEKFGGRTLGAAGLGWLAGSTWGSFVGPEGTLIVGGLGALVGGLGGEKIVKMVLPGG